MYFKTYDNKYYYPTPNSMIKIDDDLQWVGETNQPIIIGYEENKSK